MITMLYWYLAIGIPFAILFWTVTINDVIWGEKSLPWRLGWSLFMLVGWLPFVLWIFLGEVFDE